MRLGLRHLALLVAPLVLTACPYPNYNGPVEVPQLEAAVPVGAYVALSPYLRGVGAPMSARGVSAKCVDASICDVAVVGSEVRVGGKKAGRAEVVVGYEEADGRPNASRVFVNFTDGLVAPIALGKQTYEPELLQTIEQVQLGGHKANFACSYANPASIGFGEALDLGSPSRGTAGFYSCLVARPLGTSDMYYRFASWGFGYQETSAPEETAYVCVAKRPQSTDVLSISIYSYIDGVPVLRERRGEPGEICDLKRGTPSPQPKAKVVSIEESKDGAVSKRVTV
jgi:hypothetical protein